MASFWRIYAALSGTTSGLIIEAMKAAKKHGVITSFDLNYRPKLWTPIGGLEAAQETFRGIVENSNRHQWAVVAWCKGEQAMSPVCELGVADRIGGGVKVINICSMMSELGRNSVGACAAANVQVNGIGPGYFATSQTEPIHVDDHP